MNAVASNRPQRTPDAEPDAITWAACLLARRFAGLKTLQDDAEATLDHCEANTQIRHCWCALALCQWPPAQRSLNEMAIVVTVGGRPLPRWLQRELHSGRQTTLRSGRPISMTGRDAIIAATVADVCERFGLRLGRNEASAHMCASSLVKLALEPAGYYLSEASVSKIATACTPFARTFARALEEIAPDVSYDIRNPIL